MRTSFLIAMFLTAIVAALLLSACAPDNQEARATPTKIAVLDTATPGPAETETPAPPETPPSPPESAPRETPPDTAASLAVSPEAGYALYQSVGCAACHGQEGGGGTGPALAGHNREQVFRQVRAPKGDIMPAFPPERLSDEDVEQIAAWIESLGDEMAMEHDEGEEFALTMNEAAHLRLILDAIAAENEPNAIHHAQHLVDDAAPDILPVAEKLLADLQAGAAHDVEMQAGDILGPLANEGFDLISVHLGMILTALQRGNLADAEHHMASAVEAAASHDHAADLRRLQEDLRARRDVHAVIDQLYVLLGLPHPLSEQS